MCYPLPGEAPYAKQAQVNMLKMTCYQENNKGFQETLFLFLHLFSYPFLFPSFSPFFLNHSFYLFNQQVQMSSYMRLNPQTFFSPILYGSNRWLQETKPTGIQPCLQYLGRLPVKHTDRRAGLRFLHTNHPKLDGSIRIKNNDA